MPGRIDWDFRRIEGGITRDPASPQGWTVPSGELPLVDPVTTAPSVAWSVTLAYAGAAPEAITTTPAAAWSASLTYAGAAPETVVTAPSVAWSIALAWDGPAPVTITETPAAAWSTSLVFAGASPEAITVAPSAAWGLSLAFTGGVPEIEVPAEVGVLVMAEYAPSVTTAEYAYTVALEVVA